MSILHIPNLRLLSLITFLSFLTGAPLLGQKIEVENRIREENFPSSALEYVQQNYPDAKRIRYYREISGDSLSYEAKFCLDRQRYSVEFYSDGSQMDVEKQINFRTLPADTRARIEEKWSQDFRKFRIVKCQEQTMGRRIRYEIEVRGKASKETAYYQYLFEADGNFVKREEILQRPSDMNLY